MNMRRAKTSLCFMMMLLFVALSASVTCAEEGQGQSDKENAANLPEVIWRDPATWPP